MNKEYFIILFLLVGIGAHIFLAKGSIDQFSPTYDEPVHLTAGYVYWKKARYEYNGYGHPAFSEMWAAIPLNFMKPFIPVHHPAWVRGQWGAYDQYQFADKFLYHNRVSHEKLLNAGRWSQVGLSIILGLAMAFFSVPAFFLWIFSPTVLGQASLITTDLAFTTFFFLFFVTLTLPRHWKRDIAAGIFLGLSFSSKFPAIAMLPILGLCILWEEKFSIKKVFVRKRIESFVIIAVLCVLTIAFIYRFHGLSVFWVGLNNVFGLSQGGRSSFFLGNYGTEGWLHYFPVTFLIKTPIPILVAMVMSLFFIFKRKIPLASPLWIAPLCYFVIACFSKVHIGHRHIFIIYPFIFLWIGIAFKHITKREQLLFVPLMIWLMVGTYMARPHFFTYFNEFVGGPSNGYKYLTDSNVDWGQGLKTLSKNLSETDKEKGIYLSYFGVGDPHAYGIRYLNVASDTIADHKDDTGKLQTQPTTFAISATNLQATYYANKEVFSWLKNYEPVDQVDHSIFIYDFSKDPKALMILEKLRGA